MHGQPSLIFDGLSIKALTGSKVQGFSSYDEANNMFDFPLPGAIYTSKLIDNNNDLIADEYNFHIEFSNIGLKT